MRLSVSTVSPKTTHTVSLISELAIDTIVCEKRLAANSGLPVPISSGLRRAVEPGMAEALENRRVEGGFETGD